MFYRNGSIIRQLILLRLLASGGGTITTVTGVSPLALVNSLAHAIRSLTQYGKCELRDPDVPEGWVRVEYLRSSGDAYLDLGYKGGQNTKAKVRYRYHTTSNATGSGRVFGSRIGSASDAFALGTSSGVVSATGNKVFWCYDSQPYFVLDNPTFAVNEWIDVVFSATEHTVNGTSCGDDYTPTEFSTPSNLALFGFDNSGTMGVGYVDAESCQLWDGNTLLRDLVPIKNLTTAEYAAVDRVSGTILHNAGTGEFTGGAEITTPSPKISFDIVTNNGALKLSPNLLDPSIVTSGTSSGIAISEAADGTITASGSLESGTYAQFTYTMEKTLPAGTYTVSLNNPTALAAGSLVGFGINGNVSVGSRACGLNATNATKTLTIDDGDVANRLVIRLNGDLTGFSMKIQVERGEPATTYRPFGAVYADGTPETLTVSADGTEPQTVSDIPMLLSVGDYKDELEFVGGLLTHKIGVKIFDGTETFTAMSTAGAYRFSGALNIDNLQNTMVLCTHYKPESPSKTVSNMDDLAVKTNATANSNIYFKDTGCQTVADLQAKFAALYAAGTPVILLFVMAEGTTEQTTPHSLHTAQGTNVVSVTAEVSDISLTAEYKGKTP